jgi:S-formylglutathione hydrolase FrmB
VSDRTRVVAVLILLAAGLVGAAANLGWLDGLELMAPPFVGGVAILTGVLAAIVLVRRRRHWWTRTLPLLVAAATLCVMLIAWYVRASGTITDSYPISIGGWAAVALLVTFGAAATWRFSSARRRIAGLAAAPLAFAAAFLLINAHYGYWPTLGDLLGHPVSNQIDAATLGRELRAGRDLTTSSTARASAPSTTTHRYTSPLAGLIARSHLVVTHGSAVPTNEDVRQAGQFALVDIPSSTSHFTQRAGGVYLPPAYFTSARSQLGVLVMLAGTPSSPNIWATAGHALATANAYASTHDGQAPVMLFVDANGSWAGDTECVDGPRGPAESYLTTDVVRYGTDVLHLSADPNRWGIVGFSEGGTCALDLALRHPTLFHHFVDLGGDAAPNLAHDTLHALYGGSNQAMREHTPSWLMSRYRYHHETAWFGSGRGDHSHLLIGQTQDREAVHAGVRSQWFAGPGGHNWHFCTWAFQYLLPRLAGQVDHHPTTAGKV